MRKAVLLCFLVCASYSAETALAQTPPDFVLFGGDSNYPPFEWLRDDNTPTGFNIDLEQAIAAVGGSEARHLLGDWPDIIRALERGTVDVVPMFYSEERAGRFLFTPAYYHTHHAFYAKSGTRSVGSLDDLAGAVVALEELSFAHQQIQDESVTATLLLTGNTLEALAAVADDRAEYALVASPTASHLIRIHKLPLEQVGPSLWPRAYAFAINRDRPELAEWLTQSLNLTIGSGQYREVFSRWEGQLAAGATGTSRIPAILAITAASLSVVGMLGWAWSWMLRRTVASRTRELSQELAWREEAEKRMRQLANLDMRTGLPNIRHFLELAEAVLASSVHQNREKEIAALRLTDTGRVVRTFGYAAGEQLIEHFAAWLKKSGFDVCGYLGRGVFIILADRGAISQRMESVPQEFIPMPFGLSRQAIGGAAIWPMHSRNISELVRFAETALAVGMADRQPWTLYNPRMEPDKTDLRLIEDFRRTRGEGIYAVFQPQIDLASEQIASAEALVRWQHKELGLIAPGKFVPLLENAYLVVDVTRYMIKEAARVAASLRRQKLPCSISVNVTADDFAGTGLIDAIEAALLAHGAQPSDLKLELTETSVAKEPAVIRDTLAELRSWGLLASIDDFGSGYSSLSYLSAFPVHEVKIDRLFVGDMLNNKRNRSIVQSTIALAHELGLIATAEGAEDEQTVAALREDGCDRVQGYVVSKPLSEAHLHAFLRERANSEGPPRRGLQNPPANDHADDADDEL